MFPTSEQRTQIIAFVMDNATNNDTLVQSFERRCRKNGFKFSVKDGRMRCLPHTIHLSALKLLEAIGALTEEEKRTAKSKSRTSAYQDSATDSLSRDADDVMEDMGDSSDSEGSSPASMIGRAVFKVTWFII
ncbi:hypothetical protein B0H19DRAFT_938552 [Mycena capillaripes]|nr:hypothetical protein B0H19DRAFT_938552 [Mycena capillaripes]